MSVMNVKKLHAIGGALKKPDPRHMCNPLSGSVSATLANLSLESGLDGVY